MVENKFECIWIPLFDDHHDVEVLLAYTSVADTYTAAGEIQYANVRQQSPVGQEASSSGFGQITHPIQLVIKVLQVRRTSFKVISLV